MKAAPKFKQGDVIVTIGTGSLRAKVFFVKATQYLLQFDFYPTSNQPGTIKHFDEKYMLEAIRNSPPYTRL